MCPRGGVCCDGGEDAPLLGDYLLDDCCFLFEQVDAVFEGSVWWSRSYFVVLISC